MPDMTLTDLRSRSKGASEFASLIDAVSSIRSAGRLPSSVSDTTVLGYGNMTVGTDPAAASAWEGRDTDPRGWHTEIGRLGYELADMVRIIKAGRRDSGRPSAEAYAAAAGSDRAWNDYQDAAKAKKPSPAAKAPTDYNGVDDIADGLVTLGQLPSYTPRLYVLAAVYGLLSSDPTFHAAWASYDEDPQAFKALLPTAARSLAREVNNVELGAAQASPPSPFTPAQKARMSERDWRTYQKDAYNVGGD